MQEKEPHFILYFDVNKTIIMHDPVQGKDLPHILNDLLTERAYGRVVVGENGEEKWVWNGEPAVQRDGGIVSAAEAAPDVSYGNFLRAKFPMSEDLLVAKDNKKMRKIYRQDFTSHGHPGEALAKEHKALLDQLRMPPEAEKNQEQRLQAGLDASPHYFLLPAFLRFVQYLHDRGSKFNLIFRTFGDDLTRIAKEFNCFCEGNHPIFQALQSDGHARSTMDGNDGGVDRRLHLVREDSSSEHFKGHHFGTFVRSDNLTALAMGTFQQPKEVPTGDSLKLLETFYADPNLQIINGIPSIHEFLTHRWRATQTTLAIRDFYPYWFQKCEDPRAGKLLTLDPDDHDVHSLFFDDNLFVHEPHIVDARNVRDENAIVTYESVKDVHLMRVEPLDVILNDDYFIQRLHKLQQKISSVEEKNNIQ